MAKNSQLVYSSGTGYIHVNNKNQKQPQSTTAKDSNARVRLEQKGRGGKTVTTVSGIPLNGDELKELASELKRKCGSGGSVVDRVIEVQGDKADVIINELIKKGYQAKRAGG